MINVSSFLSNSAIMAQMPNLINCSGDGPMRLGEAESTWVVIVVNEDTVIGTGLEFPKNMSEEDRTIAIAEIEWATP